MRSNKKYLAMHYLMNIGIVVMLVLVTYLGIRPPRVTISENYVRISGLYGVELRIEDIEKLEMREALPRIKTRTNGMDLFGIARRGIYELEELGRTRLISFSTGGPFILMHTGNEWIVINFKNPDETESLYQELQAAVNS
jgi:hypothetical protein